MGAVEIEGAPEVPAVAGSDFFIEYRFAKPVLYSGYRIRNSEHAPEACDPKDWKVLVDTVSPKTGSRKSTDVEIQSVKNAEQKQRGRMREFQLPKDDDVYVDRIRLVVSRSQGGGPVQIHETEGFEPLVDKSELNSGLSEEARLPWVYDLDVTVGLSGQYKFVIPSPEPVAVAVEVEEP